MAIYSEKPGVPWKLKASPRDLNVSSLPAELRAACCGPELPAGSRRNEEATGHTDLLADQLVLEQAEPSPECLALGG